MYFRLRSTVPSWENWILIVFRTTIRTDRYILPPDLRIMRLWRSMLWTQSLPTWWTIVLPIICRFTWNLIHWLPSVTKHGVSGVWGRRVISTASPTKANGIRIRRCDLHYNFDILRNWYMCHMYQLFWFVSRYFDRIFDRLMHFAFVVVYAHFPIIYFIRNLPSMTQRSCIRNASMLCSFENMNLTHLCRCVNFTYKNTSDSSGVRGVLDIIMNYNQNSYSW